MESMCDHDILAEYLNRCDYSDSAQCVVLQSKDGQRVRVTRQEAALSQVLEGLVWDTDGETEIMHIGSPRAAWYLHTSLMAHLRCVV